MLFTTASLSDSSFLNLFADERTNAAERARVATDVLEKSTAHTTLEVKTELAKLDEAERQDFFARIAIVDASPRITDIPQLIVDQHLRTVRRECRKAVYERLEGWWTDQLIRMLAKERLTAMSGQEVSDKLAALADEYKSDNLPITLRDRLPDEKIDASSDNRLFVTQLRALDLPISRIQNAIVDYYRAFEQRSSWARESLLISGEVEEYERRLIDEWLHYKAVAFESIDASSDEVACKVAGKELYRWAEQQTSSLRIRERVTELYVVRGSFHMLANESPNPRVHWNPFFLKRLSELLGVAA